MARGHYAVGVPIATVLSVAPVADLIIWLWLLIAAEIAVCLMLVQEWQARPNAVAVANDNEAPISPLRRLAPQRRSRRPFRHSIRDWRRVR